MLGVDVCLQLRTLIVWPHRSEVLSLETKGVIVMRNRSVRALAVIAVLVWGVPGPAFPATVAITRPVNGGTGPAIVVNSGNIQGTGTPTGETLGVDIFFKGPMDVNYTLFDNGAICAIDSAGKWSTDAVSGTGAYSASGSYKFYAHLYMYAVDDTSIYTIP